MLPACRLRCLRPPLTPRLRPACGVVAGLVALVLATAAVAAPTVSPTEPKPNPRKAEGPTTAAQEPSPASCPGATNMPLWLGSVPPPQTRRRPKRLVSLAPSVTETLFALGLGDQVVGVTRYDTFPPAAARLPKVGGLLDPSIEAVLALKPDLVLAVRTTAGPRSVAPIWREGGVPVLLLPAERVADLWCSIDTLGSALGVEGAASALRERLHSELDALQGAAEAARPSGLVVVGHRPIVAAGPETFLDGLLPLLGLGSVLGASQGPAYPQLDLEAVAKLAPAVILDLTLAGSHGGGSAGAAGVQQFWDARVPPAARVLAVTDERLLRLGPRFFAAIGQLRRRLAERTGP